MAGLTTKQAAKELACDEAAVRRYIRQGILRAERQPNGAYLIPEEEVRRLKAQILAGLF